MLRSIANGIVVAVLLASPFLAREPLRAQETDYLEEDSGYFEEIAVDIVNVEVYVGDKDGQPVQDLTIDDFEVYEDGRPVELLNFFKVSNGRPVSVAEPGELADQTEPDEPADPLAQPAGLDETEYPAKQRMHLIVYVDNLFIDPLNRNTVFNRLRGFLYESLRPGDDVMLASFDRSLNIRHPFTSDPDRIFQALDELQDNTGYADSREKERQDAIKAIYEANSLHTALFEAKGFADNTRNDLDQSLDGLREMLESLGGLPGRKMLVHVSDGMPTVPGQDLFQAIQQRFTDQSALMEAMSYDRSQRYLQLIALANSNRVSFYTIDAAGLRTTAGMGAENPAIKFPVGVAAAIDGTLTSNLQDTLIDMADRTGGQAIYNTNDVADGLKRFAQDFDNYYSLGYRAPLVDRGRYHDIEIRLKNREKGWRVRYREGYRDKPVEARMEDAIEAFFVHGYTTNPLDAVLDMGPQTDNGDGTWEVQIRVRFPIGRITLVPRPGFHQGQVRFYFSAVDQQGSKAPMGEMPFELRIPDESVEIAKTDEAAQVISLTMKPGLQKLVVGVRDEISEVRSIIGAYVDVANKGAAGGSG